MSFSSACHSIESGGYFQRLRNVYSPLQSSRVEVRWGEREEMTTKSLLTWSALVRSRHVASREGNILHANGVSGIGKHLPVSGSSRDQDHGVGKIASI